MNELYGILQRSLTRKPKGIGVITKRWFRSGTFSSEAATLPTVKLVISSRPVPMFQIRSEHFAAMRRKKLGDTLIARLNPFVKASWDGQGRQVLLRDEAGPKGALSFDELGYLGA